MAFLQFLGVSNCSCILATLSGFVSQFCRAAERKELGAEAECPERSAPFSQIRRWVRDAAHTPFGLNHEWRAQRLRTLCQLSTLIGASPLWACVNKAAGVLSDREEKGSFSHYKAQQTRNREQALFIHTRIPATPARRNDFAVFLHLVTQIAIVLSVLDLYNRGRQDNGNTWWEKKAASSAERWDNRESLYQVSLACDGSLAVYVWSVFKSFSNLSSPSIWRSTRSPFYLQEFDRNVELQI